MTDAEQRRRVADEARDEEKAMSKPCDNCGKPWVEHATVCADGHIVQADEILVTKYGYPLPDDTTGRPTVPRVATSIHDLKVGQAIVYLNVYGRWEVPIEPTLREMDLAEGQWLPEDFERGVVILSDPEPSPVTISRATYDRLDIEFDDWNCNPSKEQTAAVMDAARALIREVGEGRSRE